MSERVVIWDQLGVHPQGEIIRGTTTEINNLGGDLVCLPVEAGLLERSGAAGYVVRKFGHGVEFDANNRRFGCSISLYAFPGFRSLSWVARVLPIGVDRPNGYLKLTGESGKPGGSSGGLVATEPPFQLSAAVPDHHGGWLIGGKAQLAIVQEGYLALALFGLMTGGRVEMLAVAQS